MEQPDLLDKRHFNKDMKDTKDMGVSRINTSFTGWQFWTLRLWKVLHCLIICITYYPACCEEEFKPLDSAQPLMKLS